MEQHYCILIVEPDRKEVLVAGLVAAGADMSCLLVKTFDEFSNEPGQFVDQVKALAARTASGVGLPASTPSPTLKDDHADRLQNVVHVGGGRIGSKLAHLVIGILGDGLAGCGLTPTPPPMPQPKIVEFTEAMRLEVASSVCQPVGPAGLDKKERQYRLRHNQKSHWPNQKLHSRKR
jgi:hypothetical protein